MDFYTVKEIVFSYADIREKEVEAYANKIRNSEKYKRYISRLIKINFSKYEALCRAESKFTWWEQLRKHSAVADVAHEILGKEAGIFLNVLEGAPISEWPAKRLAAEGWNPSEYVPFE